jgi:hypothetical protein
MLAVMRAFAVKTEPPAEHAKYPESVRVYYHFADGSVLVTQDHERATGVFAQYWFATAADKEAYAAHQANKGDKEAWLRWRTDPLHGQMRKLSEKEQLERKKKWEAKLASEGFPPNAGPPPPHG